MFALRSGSGAPRARIWKTRVAAPLPDCPWRDISTHPTKRPIRTVEQLAMALDCERQMSERLLGMLNTRAHCLAIVSRAGSDLSQRRFDTEHPLFTHSGFIVRDTNGFAGPDGGWYMDHLLNTDAGPRGELHRHSVSDFFKDDPFEYRIAISIPSPDLQERIRDVLASPLRESLFSDNYNRLAYPFSVRYQNSNQWLIEIVGAAQSGQRDRRAIQKYLRDSGLSPTVIRIGRPTQWAARFLTTNTRFDDQPMPNRNTGRIQFLIEPSLRHYLETSDPRTMTTRIHLERPHRYAAETGSLSAVTD